LNLNLRNFARETIKRDNHNKMEDKIKIHVRKYRRYGQAPCCTLIAKGPFQGGGTISLRLRLEDTKEARHLSKKLQSKGLMWLIRQITQTYKQEG
jgi:hypothetical protein